MTRRRDDYPPQQGDEAELFRTHSAKVHSQVRGLVFTSPENVDDACAHAWMQLLRRQPRRDTVIQWLVTVGKHEAFRLHGRQRRVEPDERVELRLTERGTFEELSSALHARERLETLPERDRTLVVMRGLGYTYKDAADMLGVSMGRAHVLMTRASRRLADQEREVLGINMRAHPRSQLLVELLRDPPPFLRRTLGQPPAPRADRGEPRSRAEWSSLALDIVDYRLKHRISDVMKPFGERPTLASDSARRELEQRIHGLNRAVLREHSPGIER